MGHFCEPGWWFRVFGYCEWKFSFRWRRVGVCWLAPKYESWPVICCSRALRWGWGTDLSSQYDDSQVQCPARLTLKSTLEKVSDVIIEFIHWLLHLWHYLKDPRYAGWLLQAFDHLDQIFWLYLYLGLVASSTLLAAQSFTWSSKAFGSHSMHDAGK